MKKIILFYKENKAISNVGIVAFLVSVSYAITYNMPDYFGIEAYYSLLNNICISYIAALIFYVVQVYIPESRNKKKCMEVLKRDFEELTKYVDHIILMCEQHIKINDRGVSVVWNGGEGEEEIYLKYTRVGDGVNSHLQKYTKSDLLNLKRAFDEKMNKIKEKAIINYCDYEILEKLSELEKIDFFYGLQLVIKYCNTDIGFGSFKNNLIKIKEINDSLKRMCNISEQYELCEISEVDKVFFNATQRDLKHGVMDINKINREIFKEEINKQLCAEGLRISQEDLDKICNEILSKEK